VSPYESPTLSSLTQSADVASTAAGASATGTGASTAEAASV